MTTGYILIAIRLKEHDLVSEHGSRYAEYRKQVPMLVPRLGGRPSQGRYGVGLSQRGGAACAAPPADEENQR